MGDRTSWHMLIAVCIYMAVQFSGSICDMLSALVWR